MSVEMTAEKNKEKFLTKLREYLSILEEQEQEDILAEYAQHIDMKMQKGLSEEEAIRDFGSVQELAAEILEAYHVDSQHALSAGRRRRFFGSADGPAENEAGGTETKGAEGFLSRAGRRSREMAAGIMRGIRKAFAWFDGKCRRFAKWCRKPFAGRRAAAAGEDGAAEGSRIDGADEIAGHESRGEFAGNGRRDADSAGSISPAVTGGTVNGKGSEELPTKGPGTGKVQERKGTMGRVFGAVGRGLVRMGKWFLSCGVFWLKLVWNAGWLLFSLFCAVAAMFVLMGIGMTLILLLDGYPLVGILITALGGLLCFGALSTGAFGMMIRPGQEKAGRADGKKGGEVHYEQTA